MIYLILGDGGIKGGFVAGAADTILSAIKSLPESIEVVFGASASAGNALYYASYGTEHPGFEMWNNTLTDTKFLSYNGISDLYKDEPIYDIDYMVDYIFKQKFPLSWKKINACKYKIAIPLLELDTSQVTYAVKGDFPSIKNKITITEDNMYDVIRAASAALFVYDKPTKIQDKLFVDAAAVKPFPFEILNEDDFTISIFARKKPNIKTIFSYIILTFFFIVAIRPFRKRKYPVKKYVEYALKPLKVLKSFKYLEKAQKEGRGIFIYPTEKIGGNMENSKEILAHNYESGVQAAKNWLAANPETLKNLNKLIISKH